jgi:hypothetical protein
MGRKRMSVAGPPRELGAGEAVRCRSACDHDGQSIRTRSTDGELCYGVALPLAATVAVSKTAYRTPPP